MAYQHNREKRARATSTPIRYVRYALVISYPLPTDDECRC